MEHLFTTYVRTKTVFKQRLKNLKDYSTVKIYMYELDKLGYNNGPLLYGLRAKGEIWYDKKGNFKALRDGPVDPMLLDKTKKRERKRADLTELHKWMREQLMEVELNAPRSDMSVYFKAFLDHRKEHLDPFFSVDTFSGRVHSPIVNLKGNLRSLLTLGGSSIVSLDVKQMQPTILAKVLLDVIGDNAFSTAIFNGVDVYELLLSKNNALTTRGEAKKFLFQLIFGKPMKELGSMFQGCTKWVDWINSYKSRIELQNPHKEDMHTNLAWLLQYSEVRIMMGVWMRLWKKNISFLTIHDELLCRVKDENEVYRIMEEELNKHFKSFEIVSHINKNG